MAPDLGSFLWVMAGHFQSDSCSSAPPAAAVGATASAAASDSVDASAGGFSHYDIIIFQWTWGRFFFFFFNKGFLWGKMISSPNSPTSCCRRSRMPHVCSKSAFGVSVKQRR